MGRIKVAVNRVDLLQQIKSVESKSNFSTRNDLANAVADTDWAKHNGITAPVVISRIKEFSLDGEIATKKGKRGRQKGVVLSKEHKAKLLAGRKNKDFVCLNYAELKRSFSSSKAGLIDRVAKGSLRAAIKAQCLSCCNEDTNEIRHCTVVNCPLYSFRPYK